MFYYDIQCKLYKKYQEGQITQWLSLLKANFVESERGFKGGFELRQYDSTKKSCSVNLNCS